MSDNEKKNRQEVSKLLGTDTSSRTIIFIITVIVTALIIMGTFLFVYSLMSDVKINQKKSDAMNIAQQVDYYLAKNRENLNLASFNIENYINEGIDSKQILSYMKMESKATSAVVDENFSGIYGWINGEYLDGMDYVPEADYVPQKRPWYKKAKDAKGETVFVTPYIDLQTKRLVLSISRMLEDNDSVLSMDIYLDYLQLLVEDCAKNNEHLIIVDETGTIVACENPNIAGTGYFEKKKAPGIFTIDRESTGYSLCEVFYKGKRCYSFDETILGGWHVILMVEKSDLLSSLQSVYFICYLVMTAAFFVLCYIFHKMNRQRIEAQNLSDRLSSVADIYLCMYEIDLAKDTFEEVRSISYIGQKLDTYNGKASEVITCIFKDFCLPQEMDKVNKFIDLSTLNSRFGEANSISIETKSINYSIRITFVVKNRDSSKNVSSVMLLIENIENELAKRLELVKEANTDRLSGLYNRRAYEATIDELRQLDDFYDISVVAMDLNGLKNVNDSYGHAAGDELIVGASKIIKNCWGKRGDAYRIGGDEFIVIIRSELNYPELFIQEFKERVSEWRGVLVDELGIAIGFACGCREDIYSIDDLIKLSDERMYIDKSHYYKS